MPDITKASASAEVTLLGLSTEALAASASAMFALFSLIVAGLALAAANRAEREVRFARIDEYTDKILREFDAAEMSASRAWVRNELRDHAIAHQCHIKGGLTQLNVGQTYSIVSADGSKNLQAGQISLRVLRFYGRVAKAVTEKRIDNERVIDHMAEDLVACWTAMFPWLRHKTVGDYYRWFRRYYSMSSLAEVFMDCETFEKRLQRMKRRPPFLKRFRRR